MYLQKRALMIKNEYEQNKKYMPDDICDKKRQPMLQQHASYHMISKAVMQHKLLGKD